jgi:WD40 repeat protein
LVINGDPAGENMLYCNGNAVIIRSLQDPTKADIYTEHSFATTVACYSPSGFYIASGDVSGKIRIWDTTQKEHILKYEYQPMAGPIKDIAWSGDSQRIAVGGQGRESFGQVISWDTGTTVGSIMGQSKPVNAVGFRQQRPFRIATASEDCSVAFFHGPPFKFQFTNTEHTRFVNALRYAPDGETFVSGGADGRALVFDGKTGERTGELGSPAHKGGIYALSYSPDSQQVLTVSGDKSAKIWNVSSGKLFKEFTLGTSVEDMQVGCLWQKDTLVTVSLSGFINYLDVDNPAAPKRLITGHNKPITALAISNDRETICTAASDGQICHWEVATGLNDMFAGKGHGNQVQSMCVVDNTLISCGMDDHMIISSLGTYNYGSKTKLPSQPKSIDGKPGGLVVVACINEVVVVRNGNIVYTTDVDYDPTSVSIHPDMSQVAVGGYKDNAVHVYSLNADTLQQVKSLTQLGNISALKYSPDGAYLAAADANRRVALYRLPDYECVISTAWCFHAAKVTCLDWRSDCRYLATGALDCNIMVLDVEDPIKHIVYKGAHPISNPTQLKWLDDMTLVSTGQDSHIKFWTVDI